MLKPPPSLEDVPLRPGRGGIRSLMLKPLPSLEDDPVSLTEPSPEGDPDDAMVLPSLEDVPF